MATSSPSSDPLFSRTDVAKILNVTPLTIANREKANKYPQPKRDLNRYRIYTLNDLFHLQMLTYQAVDTRPIIALLYDKGYHDAKETFKMVDAALARRGSTV